MNLEGLPPEVADQMARMATPAHVAQFVTKDLPPDARWKPYKHLDYINHHIVKAVTSPDQSFLNVAASVRSGKSELISRYLPVWFLLMFPDRQVILVSYNEDKAAEWGEFARNVMKEYGPVLAGLSVDRSSESKTYWKIAGHRGGMRSVGVGGALTGLGGDLILMDDVIKNREEANSESGRRNMWSWYGGVLRTRLMPTGTIILTMARWHEEDLTGMIQNNTTAFSDPWKFLMLPAIAEAPVDAEPTWRDEIGRTDGEALWPEVWPVKKLMTLKHSIGAEDWDSLAQQNPTPREGGMFKVANWKRVHAPEPSTRVVRFWDTAATKSKSADWTVGVKMSMAPNNTVTVLEVERFQEDPAGLDHRIHATAQRDGTTVPIRFEVGRAGEGKQVLASFRRLLVGYDIDGRKAEGKKEDRARPYASQQGDGNVTLIEADWTNKYVEEHRTFPNGRHDDQVDASVGAFTFLAETGGLEMEFANPELEAMVAALSDRGLAFR